MAITRRSLNFDFVRDGAGQGFLDPLFTFTRASTATRFNASGVLETVASNVPRFDFDPVTLACKGLLIEEVRTNYLQRSNEFGTSPWEALALGTGSMTVTTGLSGPFGLAACRLQASRGASNTSSDIAGLRQLLSGLSNPHTGCGSVWLKSNNGSNQIVQVGGGETGFTEVVEVTPQWQRFRSNISAAATPDTTDGFCIWTRGGGTNTSADLDILVAGAQFEIGAFATSYIPTTSAAVTRAAERCYTDSLSPWFSSAAGTFLCEKTVLGVEEYQVAFQVATSDGGQDIMNYLRPSSPYWYAYIWTASAEQAGFNLSVTPLVAGTIYRLALSYAANRFAASVQGGAVQTDTAGSVPAPTRLSLGAEYSGSYCLNGHLRRFTYLPFAVDDITLKAMST